MLPDRGRTEGGADWTLVRQDSVAPLDLGDRLADMDGPVVVYAHAYLKSPEDRTISLTWGGLGCTLPRAWQAAPEPRILTLKLPRLLGGQVRDGYGLSVTRCRRTGPSKRPYRT